MVDCTDVVAFVIVLGVKILIPVLPAFILFKFLPSEANVKGKWAGKRIKFGGAFAGYITIFYLILGLGTPQYSLWCIEGTIVQENEVFDTNNLLLAILPPEQKIGKDGTIGRFYIEEVPISNDTSRAMPQIIVLKSGYHQVGHFLTENLNDIDRIKVKFDYKRKKIIILDPIILKKIEQKISEDVKPSGQPGQIPTKVDSWEKNK